MNKLKKLLKKQGFTLVELIIVIAIIAVLAVAAFMMLTKWLGKSRDSRRLGDLETIKKALEITYSDTDNQINQYPNPTNWTGVEDPDDNTMWKLGTFGIDTIVDMDNMQKVPVDPSDKKAFKYATTINRKEYQIGAVLEDGGEVSVFESVLAGNRRARVLGNYDGYVNYEVSTGTRIVGIQSLLLNTERRQLLILTGTSDEFMVEGEDLETPMEIRAITFTGTDDVQQMAKDVFGLSDQEAKVIVKNNSGGVVVSDSSEGGEEGGGGSNADDFTSTFLSAEFWNNFDINDEADKTSLKEIFATNSKYADNWATNACDINNIEVVEINTIVAGDLDANKIYILNATTVDMNGGNITFAGNCTALLGKNSGGTKLNNISNGGAVAEGLISIMDNKEKKII